MCIRDRYLADFVREINELQENGAHINGRYYRFKLRQILPDLPARAMILKIVSHTAFSGCPRCHTKGMKVDGVTVFLDFDAKKRTAEEYKEGKKPHHKGVSPLTKISGGFDITRDVGIDSMHMIKGIVERLLTALRTDPERKKTLTACRQKIVSNRLTEARKYWIEEFQRAPIPLEELKDWNCTQFRSFIVYLAPWVLRDIFKENPQHYENILLLCTALRLLMVPQKKETFEYVEYILRKFCLLSRKLYGDSFSCFNVHLCNHIVDDCGHLGPLDDYLSAYKFENWYRELLSYIHSGNRPLQQIALQYYLSVKLRQNDSATAISEHFSISHPVDKKVNCGEFRQMKNDKFLFRTDRRASSFAVTKSGLVVTIVKIFKHGDEAPIQMTCQIFKTREPAFKILGQHNAPTLYKVSNLSTELYAIKSTDVIGKCFLLPLDENSYYAARLLHY